MAAVSENGHVPTDENKIVTEVDNKELQESQNEKSEMPDRDTITVFHDPENFTVKHPLMHEWTLWFTKPPSGRVGVALFKIHQVVQISMQ